MLKKLVFVSLCIVVFVGLAAAQTYTKGTGITGVDVLGAHNDGGRGCAGCHAPHSGALGGGGNAATGAAAFNDPNSGDYALFGQDVTPLYGYTLTMGDVGAPAYEAYVETLPTSAQFAAGAPEIGGIMYCLACHDGNIAKGGMMKGTLYEGRAGLLPAGVYGPNVASIPTLLGNDGTTAGNYHNDHPVGTAATLGAVGLFASATDTTNLTVTFAGGGVSTIVPTPNSAYATFVGNYGMPAIEGTKWEYGVGNPTGNTDPSKLFITCTTCHNQHVMYVYQEPQVYGATGTLGPKIPGQQISGGTYPTYFFINGPYNPGAWGGAAMTTAPSTTQFCRQCHFDTSNETFGVNNVTTSF